MELCARSLPISHVMIVKICVFYYHRQIGSMNHWPLFRVRSWNNGWTNNWFPGVLRCHDAHLMSVLLNSKGQGRESWSDIWTIEGHPVINFQILLTYRNMDFPKNHMIASVTLMDMGKTKHEPCASFRADSMFAPSQWEMALLCNEVAHWLVASLESPM